MAKTEARKEYRSRNFGLVSYLPLECIETICSMPHIDKYAYIFHDKDIDDNGKPEIPHFHIILTYRNARSLTAVIKDFIKYKAIYGQNTRVEPIIDLTMAIRYLVHLDDKDKYQYSLCEVFSNRDSLLNTCEELDNNSNVLSLLDDIISELPLREMVKRYGRDFIINYNHYTSFAHMLYAEERFLEPTTIDNADFTTARFKKKYNNLGEK